MTNYCSTCPTFPRRHFSKTGLHRDPGLRPVGLLEVNSSMVSPFKIELGDWQMLFQRCVTILVCRTQGNVQAFKYRTIQYPRQPHLSHAHSSRLPEKSSGCSDFRQHKCVPCGCPEQKEISLNIRRSDQECRMKYPPWRWTSSRCLGKPTIGGDNVRDAWCCHHCNRNGGSMICTPKGSESRQNVGNDCN